MNPTGALPRLQFTKYETEMRHFQCYHYSTISNPVKLGSNNLHYSASGQFGAAHLSTLKEKVQNIVKDPEIWILDIRTDLHFFIDGEPVVWKVAKGSIDPFKSAKEIIDEENQLIKSLTKATVVWDRSEKPSEIGEKKITTEKDLVESEGFHYLRLPFAKDTRPTDDNVQELIDFIADHPNAWGHTHCYVKKKAILALVIIDILHNHKIEGLSFDRIFYRYAFMGESKAITPFKPFLKKVFDYCTEVDPLNNRAGMKWKEWIDKNQLEEPISEETTNDGPGDCIIS